MWDERYGQDGFAYGDAPNDFLASVVDRAPPGAALDVAAGEGRNAIWLAERGYRVTAVDQSRVGLEKAKALASARGVALETVVMNLADYSFPPARFDLITLIFAHLPPPLRAEVHRAAARALRPGGALILEAYAPAQLGRGTGGPPVPELLYDLEIIKRELAPLEFEVAREIEREVVEGRYHTGPASVIQILARSPGA